MRKIYLFVLLFCIYQATAQSNRKIFCLGETSVNRCDLEDSSVVSVNATQDYNNTYDAATFNATDGWYIWHKTTGVGAQMMVMDVVSHTILQQVSVGPTVFHAFEYNKADNKIYGHGYYNFGSLDLDDSTYTSIPCAVDFFTADVHSTFDQPRSRFILMSRNAMSDKDTLVVLATNGAIIQKIQTDSSAIKNIEYDPTGHKVYGTGKYGFVSVDLDDSSFVVINPSIRVKTFTQASFDFENHDYIYHTGTSTLDPDTVVVINALTGNVKQKVINPGVSWALEYDNSKRNNGGTGVDELNHGESINVYPNPVSHECYMELPDGLGPFTITVFNTLGEICFQQTSAQTGRVTINAYTFLPGVYILEAKTAKGKTYMGRLVKQ